MPAFAGMTLLDWPHRHMGTQGPPRGLYFYLYLILDLSSRKIVGWEVHATESGEHAAK